MHQNGRHFEAFKNMFAFTWSGYAEVWYKQTRMTLHTIQEWKDSFIKAFNCSGKKGFLEYYEV